MQCKNKISKKIRINRRGKRDRRGKEDHRIKRRLFEEVTGMKHKDIVFIE